SRWSDLGYRHGGEPVQPVRAERKHGCSSFLPARAHRDIPRRMRDRAATLRRVPTCSVPRSGAAGCAGARSSWAGRARTARARRGGPAHDDQYAASTLPVRGAVELERAYAVAQIGEHDVSRPQLGRDRQRDLVRFGHGAMRAEEVQRPRRTQRAALEQRGEAIDPGPVMDPLDQVIEDRIGSGVGQLVEDGLATYEPDDAGLLGRPEVLP